MPGSSKRKLVNEELIKKDFAEIEIYKDRGELKHEKRVENLTP